MPTSSATDKSAENCVKNAFGWVEIPVTDLERAKTFYGKTFGYEFQTQDMNEYKMAMFPMVPDGNGAGGALIKGPTYEPSYDGTVVYLSVGDINATLAKITANKGKVVKPKQNIGQYGSIAFFEDSEGNRVALHQRPES
jgi:predicted enzyme related to lactoylglutathione lyase